MAYKQQSPIPLTEGGTNAVSFGFDNGVVVILGNAQVSISPGLANQVLMSNGILLPPTFQTISSAGAITTINGDAGSATPTAGVITISGSTSGLTTSASGSTVNLTGTLAIGHGGTGVTSVTIAPTATAFAGWDSHSNLSANNSILGYTTTATAGAITTLTVSSTYTQFFTGTLTQTVQLPVTSTLVLGQQFQINNNSSALVTITSSGANNIQIMGAGSQALVTCILTSGTTAASWDVVYVPAISIFPTTGALVVSSTGVVSDATASTTGFVLTSNGASTAPSFQAIPASGFTWSNVTGTTQAMAVGNGYVSNGGASLVTFTLPATAAIGSLVAVQGNGTGLWQIAQNASQTISFNQVTSTAGITGHIDSTSQYDSVTLICTVTNTGWVVNQSIGNINVT